jgi:hypothetical protein
MQLKSKLQKPKNLELILKTKDTEKQKCYAHAPGQV